MQVEGEETKARVVYGVHARASELPLWKAKLVGVRNAGERPVFDLTVPDSAEEDDTDWSFMAGGVVVHNCKNPETSLTRDSVTRLYFLQCESCGSRRSVAPIKSGFHATMRQERRKAMDQ